MKTVPSRPGPPAASSSSEPSSQNVTAFRKVSDVKMFYDVGEPSVVTVPAIGTKRGNKLCIEGDEVEL